MEFKLPDIGEGVHEGEIVKWLKQEGDSIAADEPMVEVMTDKATVEIPSPVAGTIGSIKAKEGQTIEVGKVIVVINEGGKAAAPEKPKVEAKPEVISEAKSAPKPVSEKEVPVEKAKPVQSNEADDEVLPYTVLATPATRRVARELGVSLKEVKGTGLHGRITKEDVMVHAESTQAATPRASHTAVAPLTKTPSKAFPVAPEKGAIQKIPLKGIRKRIAEAMSYSKRTAAHFTFVEEVDMSSVVKLRASVAEEAKRRDIKLTYLPFIIKALVPCLQEFPYLNSSLDDEAEEIILKGDYNIGVATDTPNGLMVPVIKNADRKSIWEIATEIQELSERARTGKATLEDLRGGTFTVTNAGSIGGVLATPVINHPEVAILGVNAIRKRPVVKDDQIVIADVMFLSISVDHRVVDGADAARFMNRLVYFLNEPMRMVFA